MPQKTSIDFRDSHKGMLRAGGVALLVMLGITIIQIVVLILWPPPTTVQDFVTLFQKNGFLGLLSMDLLYIIDNTLLILVYLGLFTALKNDAPSAALIALVLGLVGIAAYYSSNTAFQMLSLSSQYASSSDPAQKSILLGAAQAMLETYKGTAFDVYYVLNAAVLLIFAWIMQRGTLFNRATTLWAWAAGILMLIPSTAGSVGLVFSLLSLIPWMVFSALAARVLLKIGSTKGT